MKWKPTRLKFITRLAYGDALDKNESGRGEYAVFGSNGSYNECERANTLSPVIIVGRKGSYGKINWSEKECFASDTTFFIDATTTEHDLRWLFYGLQILGLDQGTVEAAVPGINRETIYQKALPLPPLPEQRAIAAFLDERTAHLDGLIRRKEDLLKLLAEQRASLITRAVTRGLDAAAPLQESGVPWLGQVPAHWGMMPLKRDIEFVTSGSRGWAEFYADEGQLFIRIGNLTRDAIALDLSDIQYVAVPDNAEAERSCVRAGDVIVSITAYLGSVALVPEGLGKAYVSQHVALIRPISAKLLPKWIAYYILSEVGKTYLQMQSYGGTKIQLSLDDIRNIPMTAPPLAEQASILAHIDEGMKRFKDVETATNAIIKKLREYRAALITAAVTGRIDVRAAVAVPELVEA